MDSKCECWSLPGWIQVLALGLTSCVPLTMLLPKLCASVFPSVKWGQLQRRTRAQEDLAAILVVVGGEVCLGFWGHARARIPALAPASSVKLAFSEPPVPTLQWGVTPQPLRLFKGEKGYKGTKPCSQEESAVGRGDPAEGSQLPGGSALGSVFPGRTVCRLLRENSRTSVSHTT